MQKTNKKRTGESASQKARQNWTRTWFLVALSAIALALIPSAASAQNTAPPTAATASATIATIRGQLNDLGRRLSIAPCQPSQWRVGIAVPMPGRSTQTVQVPACITSDHPPCEAELQSVRQIFVEQRSAAIRQRVLIASLIQWRNATEQRLLRIEQVNDRQDADLAGLEVISSQTLAYVYQLGGPWADAMVEAVNNLNGWITTINGQLAQLRTDLTAETNRATTAETALGRRVDETNETVANARRRRLTLGITVGGLYLDGPGHAPSFGLVVGGLDVIGRPIASAPSVIIAASFYAGYGETTNGSRGGFASSIYAGPGYEWLDRGRLLLQGGYTRVESSRWRETSMLMVGGIRLRGEFDLSSVFALYANVGWEWGNAIDVSNGSPLDASRFHVGGGLSAHLGNW